ncbi:ribonuclease-III-like-domain-containing protein [Lipomyces arxii]|uniref:mitochondrial 54S ribosomal protein mL57 n=1 Tax=Lipomyces arxii TaxID=56418 RepID=UPI0034CDF407
MSLAITSMRTMLRPSVTTRTHLLYPLNTVTPIARRTIIYTDGFNENAKSTDELSQGDIKNLKTAFQRLAGTLNPELYHLPESMLLQAFTHKSFRHGMFPYNERMAVYGQNLYKYYTTLEIAGSNSSHPSAVGGRNVSILATANAKKLTNGRTLVYSFLSKNECIDGIRWEPAQNISLENAKASPRSSGLYEVGAQTVFALIGLIALRHGSARAGEFIKDRILSSDQSIASPRKS